MPSILTPAAAKEIIATWVQNNPTIKKLDVFLSGHFKKTDGIFIAGGALRDQLLTPKREPKDIDIVIGGIIANELEKLPNATKNFFGGTKLLFHNQNIDIWSLTETYHLKQFGHPPTIEAYLAGAPLNFDKIVFDLCSSELFDSGCLSGINNQLIIYNPKDSYLEHIQALRCILLKEKIGFKFDESVKALLRRVVPLLNDEKMALEMQKYLRSYKYLNQEKTWSAVVREINFVANSK